MMGADEKIVLVTGASSGIGRAVALEFAARGWNVLCHYRGATDKATAVVRAIEAMGRTARLLRADFGVREELEAFVQAVGELRLDSLVNNAGAYVQPGPADQLTVDRLQGMFMLNATAPILVAVRAFCGMAERGQGRIVNISSVAAKYGGSWISLGYGCAKRALEAATRTLAREGAAKNVLVNSVRPGIIDTDFHASYPRDLVSRATLVPMKRLGRPEEVAKAVAFLGGTDNTYITGQTLSVSGGE